VPPTHASGWASAGAIDPDLSGNTRVETSLSLETHPNDGRDMFLNGLTHFTLFKMFVVFINFKFSRINLLWEKMCAAVTIEPGT
jgi:hypothetical protein